MITTTTTQIYALTLCKALLLKNSAQLLQIKIIMAMIEMEMKMLMSWKIKMRRQMKRRKASYIEILYLCVSMPHSVVCENGVTAKAVDPK